MNNITCALLTFVAVQAQPVRKPLTFDAASVKPAVVPAGVTVAGNSVTSSRREDFLRLRTTGGPGTNDPGRIHYPLVSLKGLLTRAYEAYFEIKGPGWLDTEAVEVEATMPPETTKEQFREMLANLIEDRFKLKYHVETKEIAGYSLVVAKGGLKLKESVEAAVPQEPRDDPPALSQRPRVIGRDGFAMLPVGVTFGIASAGGGRFRIMSRGETIDKLVQNLGTMLKSRVVDETELRAKYDYTLNYAGAMSPDGPIAQPLDAGASEPSSLPDIFSALQSQLGLKLEPKRVTVEISVVDHMERTPAQN
ncbi:MAG TPA: TIGR03435 family protein [Bryobacteraceae bacterium]|jgi:uncharacterized protein (TIGR03435 family)|nr:TIGR03435 family protein [Bryobacteraceae bacterium]